jgi:N-[(2S)-2-amino-2-carboxyethyl]-L-glutamate dehydrogenase
MLKSGDGLLYLSSSDVREACAAVDPLKCVSEALTQHAAGTARVGVEGVIRWSPAEGHAARTLNMPGLLGHDTVVGTKIINANTANPDRGLPRADGVTILFDPLTARPQVIMQGAEISALRTAAVSALAALHLRSSGPVTLAVIGAGKLAEAHIRLMAAHFEIQTILVNDRIQERATALVGKLRIADDHAPHITCADLEGSIRSANVIVTATTATTAYIPYQWITPGALIINVSLDDIEEKAYMSADLLYVDDWQLIIGDTARLLGKLGRKGTISGPGQVAPVHGRATTGTLGELLGGNCPSRESDEQIVVVNPFGMAIEDLAVAQAVYTSAISRGLGTMLDR